MRYKVVEDIKLAIVAQQTTYYWFQFDGYYVRVHATGGNMVPWSNVTVHLGEIPFVAGRTDRVQDGNNTRNVSAWNPVNHKAGVSTPRS